MSFTYNDRFCFDIFISKVNFKWIALRAVALKALSVLTNDEFKYVDLELLVERLNTVQHRSISKTEENIVAKKQHCET